MVPTRLRELRLPVYLVVLCLPNGPDSSGGARGLREELEKTRLSEHSEPGEDSIAHSAYLYAHGRMLPFSSRARSSGRTEWTSIAMAQNDGKLNADSATDHYRTASR